MRDVLHLKDFISLLCYGFISMKKKKKMFLFVADDL